MKVLVIKLFIFSCIVLSTQVLWASLFVPKTPQQIRRLKHYLDNKADILYLGDSTIHHYSPQDLNRGAISEMIQDILPHYSIGRISAAAYNMDLFAEIVKYASYHHHDPKIIIIPINLRSFSPEWDMRPEYQFEKEKLFLTLARHNLLFKFYKPLSVFSIYVPSLRLITKRYPCSMAIRTLEK